MQYENLKECDMTVEYAPVLDGIKLEIFSSPYRSANRASIVVNGIEYSVNRRGFNIVVIDAYDGNVVDSVAFDTWAEGSPCFRNENEREIVFKSNNTDEENLLQKRKELIMNDSTPDSVFCKGRPKDERLLKNINAVRNELQFSNILKCLGQLKIAEEKKAKIRFFSGGGYINGQVLRV